jgi:hypothetical protein
VTGLLSRLRLARSHSSYIPRLADWLSAPASQPRVWGAWFLFAATILCINCGTLTLSPAIWEDEVQIIDLGRVSLPNADLTWAVQVTSEGRPIQSTFLGCMIQELAFRLFPNAIFGVRFAAQLGLVFGSGALMGWMLARGMLPVVSLLTSILWLLEPTLTQGVRGARVDALAMMFIFLACWSVAAIRSQRMIPATLCRLGLAGISLGLAGLAWPSSVIMLPLFLNELLAKTIEDHGNASYRFVDALLRIGCVCLGSLASLAMAMIFRSGRGLQEIDDLRQGIMANVLSLANAMVWIDGLSTILVCLKASPWLIAVAFYGMVFHRRWRLLFFTCLTIVFIIATRPYFYRVVYVIPILTLASTETVNSILTDYSRHKTKGFRVALLAGFVLAVLSVGLGLLGARTYIAQEERSTRDPRIIYTLAESRIGRGPLRIYVGPWEFYYSGRILGWKMYWRQPFGRLLDWGRLPEVLDCAIFERSQLSNDIDLQFTKHGFSRVLVRPFGGFDSNSTTGYLAAPKNYDRDYILYFRPDFKLTR